MSKKKDDRYEVTTKPNSKEIVGIGCGSEIAG